MQVVILLQWISTNIYSANRKKKTFLYYDINFAQIEIGFQLPSPFYQMFIRKML